MRVMGVIRYVRTQCVLRLYIRNKSSVCGIATHAGSRRVYINGSLSVRLFIRLFIYSQGLQRS